MEIVKEQNPLQISINSKKKINEKAPNQNLNCPGRPKRKNEIRFGPEPKSVVSQLLKEKLLKRKDEIKNIKDVPEEIVQETIDKLPMKKETKSQETKQYVCEYSSCSYRSTSSSNMIKHKRRHTSEKPYLCDQCVFRTNFINSLTVHKRIHSGERPFTCELCSYRCNSSSNLKKHRMHKHSGIT